MWIDLKTWRRLGMIAAVAAALAKDKDPVCPTLHAVY